MSQGTVCKVSKMKGGVQKMLHAQKQHINPLRINQTGDIFQELVNVASAIVPVDT